MKVWEVVVGRGNISDDRWFVGAEDFADAAKLAKKSFEQRWTRGGLDDAREITGLSYRGELEILGL